MDATPAEISWPVPSVAEADLGVGVAGRMRVADFAAALGVATDEVLTAARQLGIHVAAGESVLDGRECDTLTGVLSAAARTRPAKAPTGLSAWAGLEHAFATGRVVRGRVTEAVRGGLILDLGTRAFLPGSLIDVEFVSNMKPFVGKELSVRIIELDRQRANVIVSRRAVLEEERNVAAEQLRASLAAGHVRSGRVSSVRDRGVVVDLGGIEVWIHVSEIPVDARDLRKTYQRGDEVDVTICDVREDKVVASLRTARPLVDTADVDAFVSLVARDGSGTLRVNDDRIACDVEGHPEDEVLLALQQAIDEVAEFGILTLQVLATGPNKRQVRQALLDDKLAGVDATRSRQSSTGFDLVLIDRGWLSE